MKTLIIVALLISAPSFAEPLTRTTRTLSTKTTFRDRVTPRRVTLSSEFINLEMRVLIAQEQSCFIDTIQTETVSKYQTNDEAVRNGWLFVSGGAIALAGGIVAVALAPGQPSLSDQFSRGELSSEATYSIGGVAGVLGGVGVGLGAKMLLYDREVVLSSDRNAIVTDSHSKLPCPQKLVANAKVMVSFWNGGHLEAVTDRYGRATFALAEPLLEEDLVPSYPPSGTEWAAVTAVVKGATVASAGLAPPAVVFASRLSRTNDLDAFELFRERFSDDPEWNRLEPRYRQLLTQRDAATAARREAGERAAREADALLKEGKIEEADQAVSRAQQNGVGPSSEYESLLVEAKVQRGRELLLKAASEASLDHLASARRLRDEATGYGIEPDPSTAAAFAAAERRRTQSVSKATRKLSASALRLDVAAVAEAVEALAILDVTYADACVIIQQANQKSLSKILSNEARRLENSTDKCGPVFSSDDWRNLVTLETQSKCDFPDRAIMQLNFSCAQPDGSSLATNAGDDLADMAFNFYSTSLDNFQHCGQLNGLKARYRSLCEILERSSSSWGSWTRSRYLARLRRYNDAPFLLTALDNAHFGDINSCITSLMAPANTVCR